MSDIGWKFMKISELYSLKTVGNEIRNVQIM